MVAAYLKKEDVTELNYVVCSHAHEDHVGGLSGALSVTKADNIYAPKTEANTKAYKNFKKKAEENIRNCLCLFMPDGSASCAYVYPYSVNGAKGEFFDDWANDQDFALYYAVRI